MTTPTLAALPTREEHNETHDRTAMCWLCAEGPAWWGELRRKHGLSEPPYDRPLRGWLRQNNARVFRRILQRVAAKSW